MVRRTSPGMVSVLLMMLLTSWVLVACGGTSPTPTPSRAGTPPPASTATPTAQAMTSPTAMPTATRVATPTPAPTPTPQLTGEVVVFAAASLTDAFKEIAAEFQKAHPGVTVTFNFGGSSLLRTQLAQGAKADVFASADKKNMDGAIQDGTISGTPKVFVRNEPVIVVPANNPAGITSLKDLGKSGVRLVLEGKDVPIGNYARQILDEASQDPSYGSDFSARVLQNVVSEETNVKASLTKVVLGEADATFVYRTDVTADVRDKVKIIEIPANLNITAEYYIATTKQAPNPTAAQAFVEYVLSPASQKILAKWGFKTVQ